MRAMILAAGRGQRMRPLTDHCPKPLLTVGNKPLLQWHIEALVQAQITHIVINTAWLGEQIAQFAHQISQQLGIDIHISPEPPNGLETAGGIAQALPLLGSEPFLVINGDIWTNWDRRQAHQWQHHLQQNPHDLAYVALCPNPPHHPHGDFDIDTRGRLLDQPHYTFSGIGVYHPDFFAPLTPPIPSYPLKPLLQQGIAQGCICAELIADQWYDIGTPERLDWINSILQ